MRIKLTCPACEGQIDYHLAAPWGTGPTGAESLSPWICSWCASVFVMDWRAGDLISPLQIKREHGLDLLSVMKRNAALWTSISDARAKILAAPNCRPVVHLEVVEEPYQ